MTNREEIFVFNELFIQPFAGLGHTHHQGRLVTGYTSSSTLSASTWHHDSRLSTHYGQSLSWAVTDSMEWVSLSSADPRKPQSFRQVLRCGLIIMIESLRFFLLVIFLLDPQNPNSQKWRARAWEDLGGTLCAGGKVESLNVEFSV